MKDMSNQEAIQFMQRCKHEIQELKATINHLRPQAEAYNAIRSILGLLPQPSIGYGEDLVWILDKRIKELTEEPAKSDTTT